MPALIFSFLDNSNTLAKEFVEKNYGNSSPYLEAAVNKYLNESPENQRFMEEDASKDVIPKDVSNYSLMMPAAEGNGTDFWEETENGHIRYHGKSRSTVFRSEDLEEDGLTGERTTIMRLGKEVHILKDNFKEEGSNFSTDNLWTGITYLEKKGEEEKEIAKEGEARESTESEKKEEKKATGFEWDDRVKKKMEVPLAEYL